MSDTIPMLSGVGAVATGPPRGSSNPLPTSSSNDATQVFKTTEAVIVMIPFVIMCSIFS